MAPIPATFKGSPQEWADEMVRRMQIVSPTGTSFIFVGDVEPSSNAGPWLKDGTKWYVWDESLKRYVPLDISDSETTWYKIGASTPADSTPPVWLKTETDAPNYGRGISWCVFDGTVWRPFDSLVNSGATASRPSNPATYERYYDTDISTLIWFERSQWRTVSGVPGDVKFVAWSTLDEALLHNPGWNVLGASNQALRGRFLSQATKDPGLTPVTDLNVDAGIAKRAAFETYGESDGVKIDASSSVPYPPSIAMWCLVKT